MKRRFGPAFAILFLLTMCGCREKNSTNANDAFMLWANQKLDKNVRAIHGRYWQSAHFSREYIVYLELAPTVQWKLEFIKQNNLHITSDTPTPPQDAPSWFINKKGLNIWHTKPDNGSLYEEDPQTGHFFIYEKQL
ncbi:hypothetical protein [Mucilaginibacter flavus]|uniref:hypothetical protein n=1 Tax=Mucilaginibacter flavus TaxID=931504 RepID=UPI0025B30179|nr:hypothetical protein [Mucilaginibacter flavus]MDN3581177.1 hypothetical protein [Mucilaginibacter flavus]